MKRTWWAVLLVCAMLLALLAGCGGQASAPADGGGEEAASEEEQAASPEESGEEAAAPDAFPCQLIGTVTDGGQVVSSMIIDFGESRKADGVDTETFTVHAAASTEEFLSGTDIESYGDYDIDRAIVKTETEGQTVVLYFDETEGQTLAYTSGARNIPAVLTYTVTQNKPFTLTAADGTVLDEAFTGTYFCDNIVFDPETSQFESVYVEGGINYRFYAPEGGADTLVVWFHGNGEGDLLQSNNNAAQMLANRGTVAWASEEFQEILGGAYVMAFQAPDTWYYAQRDGLLDQAAAEINDVVTQNGINPDRILVSGCSAGGYMTTRMIIAHPDLFCAAMINCPAYDVADSRGGETPTDEELAAVKASGIPVWLVQGREDSVVATAECSQRLFNILSEGQEVTETEVTQEHPETSDFTTYETPDGLYKLSLYDLNDEGLLRVAEDYDQDGVLSEATYSSHFSWVYTLLNNPQAADGTHIVNWAAAIANG